ncbi:urease accessory protein UreH domain-containing protein, partial [Falsiroseomonas oryzae]|uniref:urease accessory protein UreH domain-containing protein n=1 Tax=Falsiroseomonas oryzae TaxID=2766473 RepID=UPI0022EA6678
MLADCLKDLTAIGPGGVPAVALALFLAGLAGGATHCAGMCAPFVLAQAGALADRNAGGGMLARLAGAALVPYHLGRMLGYATLGALAGGTAGLVTQLSGLRWLLALLLLGAALLMAAHASARLPARFR